jgi:hypothetical protein
MKSRVYILHMKEHCHIHVTVAVTYGGSSLVGTFMISGERGQVRDHTGSCSRYRTCSHGEQEILA